MIPPGKSRTASGRLAGAIVSLPARTLIVLARVYQMTLSPLVGRQCKYLPTCSNYFIEAVGRWGAIRGGLLGAWRILRCNPLSRGGYDPVPARKSSDEPPADAG
jgi:hypothetical protein